GAAAKLAMKSAVAKSADPKPPASKPGNKSIRIDQMDKCGHYKYWREDLRLVRELDINYLRWGPANYKTFLGPGVYDWAWTDDVIAEMRRIGITPIIDLCHFGLPDWLGNFQN